MSITFFTFVISIFWSSMLIVALYFLRKRYSVHKKAGNSGNMIPIYGTVALVERNKEGEILERFKFILNSSNVKNTGKVVLTVILGASVLLFFEFLYICAFVVI